MMRLSDYTADNICIYTIIPISFLKLYKSKNYIILTSDIALTEMGRKRNKAQKKLNTSVNNRLTGKQSHYDQVVVDYIRYVYIIAIIIWLMIVIFLCLLDRGYTVLLLVSIPLILFLTAYSNAPYLTVESEKEFFQADCFTIGLVLVLPLFTWLNRNHGGDKAHFGTVLLLSIGLALIAVLDAWVPIRWVPVVRHVKSSFQVMAVILLIYALYMFYSNICTSTSYSIW